MRKYISTMVAMFLISAFVFALPLASASTEVGTGLTRTVTFSDPYQVTNTTVVVPTAIDNESALSYTFNIVDESNTTLNYTYVVTIMSNGTYYNGTVDIVSIANGSAVGYVNYSALTLPLNSTANITIEMLWTDNSTSADIWYGTVDIMDTQSYTIGVVLISMIMNLVTLVIMVTFIVFIVKMLTGAVSGTTKKKGKK